MPLSELWADWKKVTAQRGRRLTTADITAILRVGPVRFVVADVGAPLEWIPLDDCFRFWKSVKSNIADEEKIRLGNYQDEFAYLVTEWFEESGERIILLETYH